MRWKKNLFKLAVGAAFAAAVLLCNETQVLSWGLFNLFDDTRFSEEGLGKTESFDPDRDILYLPKMKDKDLFKAGRDLSICRREAVRRHIYLYLTRGRPYLLRAIQNSYQYRDMISDVMNRNRDLPEEIWLLPLLESGFNPRAVSPSNAVGLWQFVDNTAKPLGLRRDRWIDERRHVEKSTRAALRHIRNLRACFPDWALTLAAYNGGAGYVKRVMNKTGIQDFWRLQEEGHLREETSEYVPRFIALMVIYNNQRLFGIADEIRIPEKPEAGYLTVRKPVNLRDVARLSGASLQHLQDLNPELNHTITPPAVKNYRLMVPSSKKENIKKQLPKIYIKNPYPARPSKKKARRSEKKSRSSSTGILQMFSFEHFFYG